MALKQEGEKTPTKKSPESKQNLEKKKTVISKKDKIKEEKPSFEELLPRTQKEASSPLGGSPGEEKTEPIIEEDENIIETCKDFMGVIFEIWNGADPEIPPLTEKEKKNIAKPLARIVVKHDLGRFMKEEFVFVFYFGSAVYGRLRIKKKNVGDRRKKKKGKDVSGKTADQG